MVVVCGLVVCTVPPRINATASTSSSAQVVIDSSITLTCSVSGVPSPDIQWLINGRPVDLQAQPRLRVTADGQQLDILDAELTDAGRYTCIAKNDAGVADRDFDLQVLGTRRFLDSSFLSSLLCIICRCLTSSRHACCL